MLPNTLVCHVFCTSNVRLLRVLIDFFPLLIFGNVLLFTAYEGSLEATLRDKVFSLGQVLSTIGLSVMD